MKLRSENELTTIRISRNTRAYLTGRGKKGETYDSIIWRMIEGFDKLAVMTAFTQGVLKE